MNEIPETLKGVLANGNTRESLEALRNFLATILDTDFCPLCERHGPETKEIAPLALRLTNVIKELDELDKAGKAPEGAPRPTGLSSIRESQASKRTGAGTQSTKAPTSVAKTYRGRKA